MIFGPLATTRKLNEAAAANPSAGSCRDPPFQKAAVTRPPQEAAVTNPPQEAA